jgi:ribosomal protein S18 acetylase RimI-like enzyme
MSSAYGGIETHTKPVTFLPLVDTLDDGSVVEIVAFGPEHLDVLHRLLNEIIAEGKTYPQEQELTIDQFRMYFQTAYVLKEGSKVLGSFYVKPNFPGRCSHICNGGFIVQPEQRGRGVGKALGRAFLKVAPAMGYRASMFNLVFENNTASVKLWNGLGFEIIGRLPKAGRLVGSDKLIDALMFYKEFASSEPQ